jgi:PilZ domain
MHQIHRFSDPSDTRRAARRGVELRCDVITQTADEPLAGTVFDLSPFGMSLKTPVAIDEGETVVLSFRPPRTKHEMTVFGRVRYAGDDAKGVEFAAMTKQERVQLFDALRGIPPRLPETLPS